MQSPGSQAISGKVALRVANRLSPPAGSDLRLALPKICGVRELAGHIFARECFMILVEHESVAEVSDPSQQQNGARGPVGA
jgi:hypothetical protein